MAEKELSDSTLYSARPTIRVDGKDNQPVSDAVQSIVMTESEGGMSSLEMRLQNFGTTASGPSPLFEDEQAVQLGSDIGVYTGDVNAPTEIFRGVVTGIEADFPVGDAPEMVVLAEDKLQSARLARRSKVYENLTLSSLANTVASSLGLTPKVTGLTTNIGTHVQLNESDLAFLRRLLARYDGDMQVVADELHVSPRSDVSRGEVELALYSQLRGVRFVADLAHQVTEMTCAGWDEVQGKQVTAKSTGANAGPGSGRTGSSLLKQKFSARSEHVGYLAVTTSDEATALADAAFDRRSRRFVTVHGTTDGNPQLRVGTNVKVTGASTRFDNTYYVVRAVHRFDLGGGYITEFEGESSYLGNA